MQSDWLMDLKTPSAVTSQACTTGWVPKFHRKFTSEATFTHIRLPCNGAVHICGCWLVHCVREVIWTLPLLDIQHPSLYLSPFPPCFFIFSFSFIIFFPTLCVGVWRVGSSTNNNPHCVNSIALSAYAQTRDHRVDVFIKRYFSLAPRWYSYSELYYFLKWI